MPDNTVRCISDDELRASLAESLRGRNLKKVLLLPPDYTRLYSGAGKITAIYYDLLKDSWHSRADDRRGVQSVFRRGSTV